MKPENIKLNLTQWFINFTHTTNHEHGPLQWKDVLEQPGSRTWCIQGPENVSGRETIYENERVFLGHTTSSL